MNLTEMIEHLLKKMMKRCSAEKSEEVKEMEQNEKKQALSDCEEEASAHPILHFCRVLFQTPFSSGFLQRHLPAERAFSSLLFSL